MPVADQLTRGAFLAAWRLMSIDGLEWDAPDTPQNSYRVKRPGDRGTRHTGPATIKLVNLRPHRLAA